MYFILGVCVLLLVVLHLKKYARPRNFPPGPPSLPIVGSFPFYPNVPSPFSIGWKYFVHNYGKIVGVMMGHIPVVVVYDFELIKDVFNRDEIAGRPQLFTHSYRMKWKKQGIIFNDGPSWKSHRKFTLRTLKDLGLGKQKMEHTLQFEANQICDKIASWQGRPLDVKHVFNVGVLNILWKLVGNVRYDLDDPSLLACVRSIDGGTQGDNTRQIELLPILRHIPPFTKKWDSFKGFADSLLNFATSMIEDCKRDLEENIDQPEDFVTAYLKEQQESPENKDFNDEALAVTITDLFAAGSDTSANTLTWAILYMVLHPKCQKKVQDELDEILVGREPAIEDRSRLVYTEATLAEIQRKANIVPGAVPHKALRDTVIDGYSIPKDTVVCCPLYYVMSDPEYWQNPQVFNPERFIENGVFRKDERLIPFGIGKRSCLGESLARNELLIIFARMLQRFHFVKSPDHPDPEDKFVPGFLIAAKPFHVLAHARSE